MPGFPIGRIQTIELVKKRACKWIISFDWYYDYKSALTNLNILPLSLYLQILDIVLLSKIMNGFCKIDWPATVDVNLEFKFLRSAKHFQLPRMKYEIERENFFYRTCRTVNNIPAAIDVVEFRTETKVT